MRIVLCVTLWPVSGREEALVSYEDEVLALLPNHGARVVARVRAAASDDDGPYETQIIEFPDESAMERYLADPGRTSRTAERDASIARTGIQRVVEA